MNEAQVVALMISPLLLGLLYVGLSQDIQEFIQTRKERKKAKRTRKAYKVNWLDVDDIRK